MNKNRYILQKDFNGMPNGYYAVSDGSYDTEVNWGLVGLDYWRAKLTYHIR